MHTVIIKVDYRVQMTLFDRKSHKITIFLFIFIQMQDLEVIDGCSVAKVIRMFVVLHLQRKRPHRLAKIQSQTAKVNCFL